MRSPEKFGSNYSQEKVILPPTGSRRLRMYFLLAILALCSEDSNNKNLDNI